MRTICRRAVRCKLIMSVTSLKRYLQKQTKSLSLHLLGPILSTTSLLSSEKIARHWGILFLIRRRITDPLAPRTPPAVIFSRKAYESPNAPIYQPIFPERNHPKRTRKFWTDEETILLGQGIAKYGHDWKSIVKEYDFEGKYGRTAAHLKDRARNVKKMLIEQNRELGVWN